MPSPLPRPPYIDSVVRSDAIVRTADGRDIEVWELLWSPEEDFLAGWATRFRQAYCLDDDIDRLRQGTGMSRLEYLTELVFPSANVGFGPATRAGDFTELLLSDFLESELGVWVPREKYMFKANPNESVQGVDVVGFGMSDYENWTSTDILVVCEVKAGLSASGYADQLQKAIDDSSKDYLRAAYTLNATKRRLLARGDSEAAAVVERFQNKPDRPYRLVSKAAAVLAGSAYDENSLSLATADSHNNADNLSLLVIRGSDLMDLVHALYSEAARGA